MMDLNSKLLLSDRVVNASGLLTYSPISNKGLIIDSKYLIEDIKNQLINNEYDIHQAKILLDAIKLYDEQLLRQYEENKNHIDDNNLKYLFFINKDDKFKLIKKQYIEIITRLKELGGFVCGFEDNNNLDLILEKGNPEGIKMKKKLLSQLANYCSLEEAKNGLIYTDAVERFARVRTK